MNLGAAPPRSPLGVAATLGWGVMALLPFFLLTEVRTRWLASGTLRDEAVAVLANLSVLAVVGAAVRLAGWSFRDYVGLGRPAARDVALGLGAQIALSLAAFAVLSAAVTPSAIAQMSAAPREDGAYLGYVLAFWPANVLVGPFCEEIFWHGFLYRGIAARMGPFWAIVGISLVFALLHFADDNIGRTWHLLCGLLFGALRWHTGSLTAPIAAHMFANGVAAAFRTFGN